MPSRKSVKTAASAAPNLVLDEVKSLADVVRSIKTELFWLKASVATSSDAELIKTELRLVRGDLAALEKRLATAEPEAKLTA